MEREAYDSMYQLEDSFWWYAGMRTFTCTFLSGIELPHGRPRVLDAGCGTGANLKHSASIGTLTGIDIDAEALSYCRQRGITALVQASVTDLPFSTESFELVFSFEVLYHAQVGDDVAALRESWRLLTPGRYCVVRSPAYQWLMGAHDAAVHTRHRYAAAKVRRMAEAAGFEVESLTYLNAILLPLATVRRLLARQGDKAGSDVNRSRSLSTRLCGGLCP